MEQRKLHRAVIKEELVAITGNYIDAIILNQLIYWSERVQDFDKFIAQEKLIAERHGEDINFDLTCGWIYKTSDELSEESLLGLSKSNMRVHIKNLISLGFIQERDNPKYKWDKTKQYRVNIVKIQTELQKLGYCLEGYPLVLNCDTEVLPNDIRGSKSELYSSKSELCGTDLEQQYQRLQTEITTENIYIAENFETLWEMLPPTPYDRKSKVSDKRKKELYLMTPERTHKAIKLYLKTRDNKYSITRNNFLNEAIENFLDKDTLGYSDSAINYDLELYEKMQYNL